MVNPNVAVFQLMLQAQGSLMMSIRQNKERQARHYSRMNPNVKQNKACPQRCDELLVMERLHYGNISVETQNRK